MKSIILSVSPQEALNVLNGDATMLIRKKIPKGFVGWCYLYVTKSTGGRIAMNKPYLFMSSTEKDFLKACNADIYLLSNLKPIRDILNGKVVAKCEFMEVEEIACERLDAGVGYNTIFYTETRDSHEELCDLACLDISDLKFYLGEKDKGQIVGYAYHISNLEIFDTPKELGEFYVLDKAETKRYNGFCKVYKPLTKAPKSWCYVEE